MTQKTNSFHLVSLSPWPIMGAFSSFLMVLTLMMSMNKLGFIYVNLPLAITSAISYLWWRDVYRESTLEGSHHSEVIGGLKMGMIFFIVSEVLFFLSFFWSYLHSSISPTHDIGMYWPPVPINPFNPVSIPLLNTVLLLSSGVSVTWAHHLMMKKYYSKSVSLMWVTIFLGVIFSAMQLLEYKEAQFSISDSVFSSTFFMSTGFHGLHVIIGTTFLLITAFRMSKIHLSFTHVVGFECAAWYWHFVDVVWLFLYTLVYWWSF